MASPGATHPPDGALNADGGRARILLPPIPTFGGLRASCLSATAGGGHGGNSANAKLCQKGGWQNLVRSYGSSFANQGKWVS